MAHRVGEAHEPPSSVLADLPRLLNRFVEQVLQLLEAQFALARSEIREAVHSYVGRLARVAAAGVVGLVGFTLLNVGVVLWLDAYVQNRALSFALVGAAYLVLGGVVATGAARRLGEGRVLVDTKRELERDKQWIKSKT